MSSKYASFHLSPQGPGDARPTALQIIKDEGLEDKLSDKVVLITGCSSGLGVETASALLVTGATLYLAVRNPDKAKAALGDMSQKDRVHLLTLDLNDLTSVRACAADFATKSKILNILINNAGVMATPEGKTSDGFETQFGTNYVAHFLFFQLLKPILVASSTPEFPSRLVNVSSSLHRACEVQFDNFNWTGNYDPWKAYGQSKTALVWMANEVERRYGSQNLHAFSLHPGGILSGLQQHVPDELKEAWGRNEALAKHWKSAEQGAATTVWAAVSKDLEGRGGKYLEDCQIIGAWDPATGDVGSGYAMWAYDQEKAERLWSLGLKLAGLPEAE
ncbi:oxidoreductase [Colletotrichum scovillei]|uniref:Short-chain dehydrogenase n=1 Tax=Colletotrichum scovillei TaxID=1209932 RepID=A0A9P7R3G4_9PEZI|nr:oxidoreductase [Colletotrichum scovillei]KAF4785052.1 oxidoreductase [Colletotrichum scovillei]KAG7048057.1 short-chain dehydrogenase [Colletotrichum scovillei]KAG7065222.1 short-chain dehydrogenase [Colletotrichum scovillei]KAG7067824.1 short-chain dehydrogenase [Colletotrichum scovillei]